MTVADRFTPPACPAAEQLAAYIDGTLTIAERQSLEQHLVGCADCRHVMSETFVLIGGKATGWRTRTWRLLAVGGLAAAVLVLAIRVGPRWWKDLRGSSGDPLLQPLVAAVGTDRVVEARLSGGFQYGQHSSTRSGAPEENLSLTAAAGVLQKAAQADPSAVNLHAWGVAQLLIGKDDDEAVRNLASAAVQDSRNAAFQNDLAAARIVRNGRRASPEDLPAAVQAARSAIALDSTLLEAWFNLALAIEKVDPKTARDAWQQYLNHDPSSKWADEARTRLSSLPISRSRWPELERDLALVPGRPTLRATNPETAGQLLEDSLLPTWGRTYLQSAPWDKPMIRSVAAFARTVSELQHDPLLAESVAQIERLTDTADRVDAARLAHAYVTFGEMKAAFNATRMAEMGRRAGECATEFRATRSPMMFWCDFYNSAGAYYQGHQALSQSIAIRLTEDIPRRFTVVAARVENHLGGLAFVRGDYQLAIQHLRAAADALDLAQSEGMASSARRTLASAYVAVSEINEAWGQYIQALSGLQTSTMARHSVLVSAGNAALTEGYPWFALELFDVSVSEAQAAGAPGIEFESVMSRARARQAVGLRGDAARDFEWAERLLPQVPDPGVAARLRADLRYAEAEFDWETDPALSVQFGNEALQTYRGLDTQFRLSELLRYRARAAQRLNHSQETEESLLAALRATDAERKRIDRPRLSSSFINTAWGVHQDLIRLYTSQGRDAEALLVMEHSRRAFDFDAVRGTRWLETLPPADAACLVVADLGDEAVAWFVRPGHARAFRIGIAPAAISLSLEQLSSAFRVGNAARASALLAALYAAIIRPVASELTTSHRVVVIASGALEAVPFAALKSVGSRYLVQDVELASATSIGNYVAAVLGSKPLAPRPIDAWVLCAPLKGSAGLDAPPQSRQEGLEVARTYPRTRTSCEEAATQEVFAEALTAARVVHFSGHAILDTVDPWSSKLVVSPSRGNPFGILFLRDIEPSRTWTPRPIVASVVVLAACSTAVGRTGRRDLVSLASAFQRLGVPWVVATQWDVEDTAARELFTRVHANMAAGDVMDPASALRGAQLSLIDRGDLPQHWAGVVAMASAQTVN